MVRIAWSRQSLEGKRSAFSLSRLRERVGVRVWGSRLDVEWRADHLRTLPHVDPSRLMLTGGQATDTPAAAGP
ncbi:hypothetical protein [Paramagnetospirillum marisnigri]|uniref:hypothetical protein n=1 Tax=Paramagnetospirillum marisnigri TaxID=1285242 RepID=UPI000838BA9A|nr:hypothetical protein [Paramagnetospirillum marisnigri]